ncbi:hypothetical protein CC78DRAFT_586334 [Lojkania enalia]|uniref:Uncharacterized protein n=1 Tax=Lojkania enalia TaxID=147567 RepID=A0A9P4MVK3_9PLEO|nr:hypothetical protein CC78DRAFT_586334 [Didymosphaeria enalia]
MAKCRHNYPRTPQRSTDEVAEPTPTTQQPGKENEGGNAMSAPGSVISSTSANAPGKSSRKGRQKERRHNNWQGMSCQVM